MKSVSEIKVVGEMESAALLRRGNWKSSVEGWSFWATEYNRLLIFEGKEDQLLRLDIVTNS